MVVRIKRISGHMPILTYSHSELLTHILEDCEGGLVITKLPGDR